MKISVIIVSYNVRSYLRQCLNSIYKSTGVDNIEIIVVDNFSFDNTCTMIREEFPQVILIENDENKGFSFGVNQGIRASSCEFICLLNPDTLIQSNTLSTLSAYLKNNPKTGCIGPKILNTDGTLQPACKRSFPSLFTSIPKLLGLSKLFPLNKWFGKYNLTYLDCDEINFVDAISGSFMLMPRAVVEKVGHFDERFFMFGEDLDYCYRIRECGFNIVYNPQTQIIHYKGESVKVAPRDMVKVFYNAMDKFFEKYQSKFPSWKIMKVLVMSGIVIRKVIAYFQLYRSRIISQSLDIIFLLLSIKLITNLWNQFYIQQYSQQSLTMNILISWLISVNVTHLYKKGSLSYGRSAVSSVLLFLFSSTIANFHPQFWVPGIVLFSSVFIYSIFAAGWRVIVHILYRYGKVNLNQRSPIFTRRAVILGLDKESQRIGQILHQNPETDFHLVGFVGEPTLDNSNLCLGRYSDLSGIIRHSKINELIIPENLFSIKEIINILEKIIGMNVIFKMVPAGQGILIGKGMVENLSGIQMINLEFPLYDHMHLLLKRIFDILISMLMITATLPIHLYYNVLERKQTHTIWTINNQILELAEYESSSDFIRELPYLFSILTGKISFVGSQMIKSSITDPKLLFKPGLTGLAQLRYKQSDHHVIPSFDYYYLQNHSFIFDLEIILKSIFKI